MTRYPSRALVAALLTALLIASASTAGVALPTASASGTAATAPAIRPSAGPTAGPGAETGTAAALDEPLADESGDVVGNDTQFRNELVFDHLFRPTAATFLPDGRLLILQKDGTILLANVTADSPRSGTYMTVDHVKTSVEAGLLDVALDPNFTENGYFYVYYTNSTTNRSRISRYHHEENDGGLTSRGDPDSEAVVWEQPRPIDDDHHVGGSLDVGPDGRLYLTMGDQDVPKASQNLSRVNGKILRLDRDGTVPETNPFVDDADALDSVWAYGLRNPFRASWDRQTGRFFVGDVGGNQQDVAVEELDLGEKGANYGWPDCEGYCQRSNVTDPLYAYPHNGTGASITAGPVYRGGSFPDEYEGAYFYADYAREWIRYLTFDGPETVAGSHPFETDAGGVVDILQGPDGALYYLDITNGALKRIVYRDPDAPTVESASANRTSGDAPLSVAFAANATDPQTDDLTYTWQFDDGDEGSGAEVTHTYDEAGRYSVRVLVSDGTYTVRSDPIEITVGDVPNATVSNPDDGDTFRANDTITFEGSATDPTDGELTGTSLTWQVAFNHNEHTHPVLGPVNGSNGSFTVPSDGHSFHDDTGYTVTLTANDSDGLTDSDSVRIDPEKSVLTLATDPSGLTVKLDGVPHVAPFEYDEVIGFRQDVGASKKQCVGDTQYVFEGWSDGGDVTHTVTVPETDATLTATYAENGSCGSGTPTIDAPDEVVLQPGDTESVSVVATDPDGDSVTLTASNVPPFGDFDTGDDGNGTLHLAPESGDEGTYEVTFTASDGNASTRETLDVVVGTSLDGPRDPSASGEVVYRVNAGEETIPAADGGPDWQAVDGTYAVGGDFATTTDAIALDGSVPDGTPEAVFQSELFGQTKWTFPVDPNETYEVRLYFAEIDSGKTTGDRVFDVDVEGASALDDYDVYADVGADTGTAKAFAVSPADDSLTVTFLPEVDNPKVSAVELVRVENGTQTTGDGTVAHRVNAGGDTITSTDPD
ncbi:MAG: PQQ-dependent sugar dehydrogenase, partial [Halobacteriaceae archaeon]